MREATFKAGLFAGGIGAAGTALAVLNAGVWFNYVAPSDSPYAAWGESIRDMGWALGLAVTLGIFGAILANSKGNVVERASRLCRVLAALILGSISFLALHSATRSWIYSDPRLLAGMSIGLGACAALIGWLTGDRGIIGKKRAMAWGIICLIGWPTAIYLAKQSVFADSSGMGGLGAVLVLRQPIELQKPMALIPELVGGSLAGAIMGAAIAAALSRRLRWGACAGFFVGLIVSAACYMVQTQTLAAALRVVYADNLTFSSALRLGLVAAWTLALAAGLTAIAWERTNSRSFRYATAGFAVAVLIAYFSISGAAVRKEFAGHDLLARALMLPPDGSRVYLHLSDNGMWNRSIEQKASPITADLCDKLITRFPNSSYRPAALYLKASTQFEDWSFGGSAATLERLRREYPLASGASGIPLFLSYIALGDYQRAGISYGSDWIVARWVENEGAQIMAAMWERLGKYGDASGAYSLYADYVRGRMGPGAAARVLALSAAFAEKTSIKPPASQVRGRVLVGRTPARGVIVALVQPRLEAAYLPESQRFVNARTLPMWRGISAKTDERGLFCIKPVLPGEYELVLGFDEGGVPPGYTLSAPPESVKVQGEPVEIGDLNFVPRIELIRPDKGLTANECPLLKWSKYPVAASYSVSILRSPVDLDMPSTAETCWVKTGIKDTSVKVTADGFNDADGSSVEAAQKRLLPGRRYLCWIYAYDSAGRLLATSEDYYSKGSDSIEIVLPAQKVNADSFSETGGDSRRM